MAGKGKAGKASKRKKKSVAVVPGPVVLDTNPGIQNIGELKAQLLAANEAGETVIVDAGKVESVDTAVLQLLVAFVNTVREQSRTVEWSELSSAFRDMATLADLGECLGVTESQADSDAADEDDDLCPVF